MPLPAPLPPMLDQKVVIADVRPEFILPVERHVRGKESASVERRVAEVLISRAVKLIGPRFQLVVVESLPLVLRLLSIHLHLKLLDRFHRDTC